MRPKLGQFGQFQFGLKIFILAIVFISIVISTSTAYERPAYEDALMAPWHTGGYCIPCHYSLLGVEEANKIRCKTCHDYRPKDAERKYDVDMSEIFDIHKDNMCIKCHIGTKDREDITVQEFHMIMPIECLDCHDANANGTYLKPEKKECSECHYSGDPHLIHGKKIEELCIPCHGEEFANKYIDKTIEISEKGIISVKPEVVKEYPTIGQFFGKILQVLLKIGE